MGKRGGYHGLSPADKSINAMDKFIRKSERVQQSNERTGKQISDKDFASRSLREQLDYLNNRSENDIFDENYPSYSYWYDAVKKRSGIYPQTFRDWTSKHKPFLQELFNKKTSIRDAIIELKKLGIY